MTNELWTHVLREVRAPLASIKEAMGLLLNGRQGTLSPDQQMWLNVATSNVERLERMVSQLLELVHTQDQWPQTKRTLCDIAHLIAEVSHLVQPRCDQKGIRLMLKLPAQPVRLWASRDHVVQVVMNLVDNAIKYTGRGGSITIEVRDAGGDEVELRVKDTGIGIPKEEQDLVFERGWRSPKAQDAGGPGGGLGLAMVKEMVTLHGGRVWVESAPGQGSEFFIHLPTDFRRSQAPSSTEDVTSVTPR